MWCVSSIDSARATGLLRGVQTIRQLLPTEALSAAPQAGVRWSLPCVEITDVPRHRWRGAMLDVARHFQPVAYLHRYVDLLALHKLHFFPSDPKDLLVISPAIVAQLEPILLTEPVNQPEKWLKAKEGSATPAFLEALKNFMYWENYDVRVRMDGKIDRVVLEDILKKRSKKRN